MGDKHNKGRSHGSKKPKKRIPPSQKRKSQPVDIESEDVSCASSSAKKLKATTSTESSSAPSTSTKIKMGYGLVEMEQLIKLGSLFSCSECLRSGTLTTEIHNLGGLAQRLVIDCKGCGEQKILDLNQQIAGTQVYAVNRRYTVAICSIGGHEQMGKTFAGNMSLPPPVQSYSEHLDVITAATVAVAKLSKEKAATEAIETFGTDIGVSCDGTWMKRGFSSKNGVATVLTNMGKNNGSKVIDTEVLTTFCAKCCQANNENTRLSKVAFHKCLANHQGSSGKMEGEGVLRIFKRSVQSYGSRYTRYLGDGDSKSYGDVVKANVYDGVSIAKEECCGHVQKRMGKALMTVVADSKGKSFVVDKDGVILRKIKPDANRGEKLVRGIGGVGKLTAKAIKSIQGHFGGAIRNNTGNLSGMKKDIWDIYHHRSGDHSNCPQWCPRDDLEKANKSKLPKFVCQLIRPVFERLSADTLLEKCLHGGTQNANESFHNIIWSHCPKVSFAGRTRLELAVADSTIVFNDGQVGRLDIFHQLGLMPSSHQIKFAHAMDQSRVKKSIVKASAKFKKTRAKNTVNATDRYYDSGAFD